MDPQTNGNNSAFFSAFTGKTYVEVDAGKFSVKHNGLKLSVWVNPPGIVEAELGGRAFTVEETTDENGKVISEVRFESESPEQEYRRKRKAVALLYERPPEEIAKLDDTLVDTLWNEGMRCYREYHAELKNA